MHTSMSALFCIIFSTVCVWIRSGAAQNVNNLDVLEPVVRISPDRVSPTLDGVNDYFGWSAIFHAIEDPSSSETIQSAQQKIRVIVGAPFGTFPGGLPYTDIFQPRQNRSGLVYNCPVFPGNCEGVRGDVNEYVNDEGRADNTGESLLSSNPILPVEYCEGRLFDQAPKAQAGATDVPGIVLQYDFKEDQLVGATLYSNGATFIACAPRWQLDFTFTGTRSTRGMCYSSGPNLQGFVPRMACTDAAQTTDNNRDGLQCLSGYSAVVNDGHVVIGVPGYSRNRGLLASQPIGAQPTEDFMRGDSDARDNSGNVINSNEVISQDQYQGFRVVNAHILSSNHSGMPPNLVTSVPRAGTNKDGRLHVYESPTTLNTLIFTNATGTQIGEFFGYSLTALDLDNDGYDDILVGAPMYTDFDTERLEKGRVYIFRTIGGQLSGESRIVIEGPYTLPRRARFGTSLTSLGDVDYDGFLDFAVGAPYYQTGSSPHTGAVFIYYGRQDPADIPSQMPFVITADTMAMNVVLGMGMSLNTFGFSVSSGYDIDANGYNDLLVGAYESQSVFVLRSLPVATVEVAFVPHPTVNVHNTESGMFCGGVYNTFCLREVLFDPNNYSFELGITASFRGFGVANTLDVMFELREVVRMNPRIFFSPKPESSVRGMGVLRLTGHGVSNTTNVTLYTDSDIGDINPLVFEIQLLEISRNVNGPVTGNEALSDLSSFPRLRLQGETSTEVDIVNFCGTDGCKSDVLFGTSASEPEIEVVANGPALSRLSTTISNNGSEPAFDLAVSLTSIPDFVTAITVVDDVFTACQRDGSNLTCLYSQRRFENDTSFVATFEFGFDTSMLIGNETDSMIVLHLLVPEMNLNEDTDISNNVLTIRLRSAAQADISISSIEFSPPTHEYTAVAPSDMSFISDGVGAQDTEITLVVTIGNQGPSTIQDATLEVFFPSRQEFITRVFTYLYPYDIRSNPMFSCNRSQLDPDGFDRVSSRRKRSTMTFSEMKAQRKQKRAASKNPALNKRTKRQDVPEFDLDCTPGSPTRADCTRFTCSISNLRRDNVSVTFHSRIDERYFATLSEASRKSFNLRAYAAVQLDNDYIAGDGPSDNMNMVSLVLEPTAPVPEQEEYDLEDFLHVTLWPAVGSILALLILTILLYFCGFFRRKKKPDQGEFEGEFAMPSEGGRTNDAVAEKEEEL